MYNFDTDLINKYEQIKHKIYVEYCNNNITLIQREILLKHAQNDIFNNEFNFIIESDDDGTSSAIIEQKQLKSMTRVRMLGKLASEKKDLIEESIKNIDEEKRNDIHFIFLNRDDEIDSIIKILDYFYKFITDPSSDSENYNHRKDDLIAELNDSCKNVKIESYSINSYNNKFKVEFNDSEINQYEKKYNMAFSSSHIKDILEKYPDNAAIIKNSYTDFFRWFGVLLGYKNMYFNQMCRSVKISEIYQNQLYEDYNNNKSSYGDLRSGNTLLQKLFQSVYKEYYDILNSKFEY